MIDVTAPFTILPYVLRKREHWGALPTKCDRVFSEYPLNWLDVRFTETDECFTKEECSRLTRELQRRHMEEGLPDIKYNFLIGGDWAIYEGRGWRYMPDNPPTKGYSEQFVDIAYIGPTPPPDQNIYPTIEMKHTLERIIEFGYEKGYLNKRYNEGQEDRIINTPSKYPLFDQSFINKYAPHISSYNT